MRAPRSLVVVALLAPGCHLVFGVDPGAGVDADTPMVTITSFDTPSRLALGQDVRVTAELEGPADVAVGFELVASIGEVEGGDGNILLAGGTARLAATYRGTVEGSAELTLRVGLAEQTRTIEVAASPSTRTIGDGTQPSSTFAFPSGTLYGTSLVVDEACWLQQVGLWIATTASRKIHLGLYRQTASNLARVVDLGAHESDGGGRFAVSLASPLALEPATYFVVVAVEQSTAIGGTASTADGRMDISVPQPFGLDLPATLTTPTQDLFTFAVFLEVTT